MLNVHTDAAVKGNPGLAGAGVVVSGKGLYEQLTFPLEGMWDNHSAEFEAILIAMQWLIQAKLTDHLVFMHSDSKTAVDLIQRGSSKNPSFSAYLDRIYGLEDYFTYISIDWKSERQNRGADNLARQALHQAIANKN